MNKKQKIVIIGSNHAGTSFIRTFVKIDKLSEIVVYDQNSNISYLGCGTALWVKGEFDNPHDLFYSSANALQAVGATININHKVIKIDSKTKTIKVKNIETNKEITDTYDKLVFAAGTWPIMPPFKGINLKNIYITKLFQHAKLLKQAANDPNIENVVIVGAGYIGVELVEAFNSLGKSVTIIDMTKRVISNYFDHEFTDILETRMKKGFNGKGVKLAFGEKVLEFTGKNGKVSSVITDKATYNADIVILSIGMAPQTQLLKGQVDMIENGAIKVNEYQVSSNKDIYVIGDAAALYHKVFKSYKNIALATNAIKTGIIAALHITNKAHKTPLKSIEATNSISVYGCHYSSTGLSEESLKKFNIPHKSETLDDNDRPEFMKKYGKIKIKITYDPKTLKLLGAQIGTWDEFNHSDAIYVLSLAIKNGMTLYEIVVIDFFFLPHFNKPLNFIVQVALNAIGFEY